jgi:predicted Fe-Mo cluster-binding NifX family protein
MKIAIASDDELTIAAHFGRTRGFVIFDIENGIIKERKYRINNFTGHARGLENADHQIDRHGPILAALKDCDVVISSGMGRRICNDLQNAGIEAFIVDETDANEAVGLFLENALKNNPEKGCEH